MKSTCVNEMPIHNIIGDNVFLSIFERSLPKNWLNRWALYYFKIRYHRVSSQSRWKPACFHRNPDKSDRSLIEIYVLYNLPFLHHAICITATISWKRLCICFVTHRRTGRGGRGGLQPPPQNFGQLRFFGQQAKIWAKPVFKDVSMFFY